MWRDRTPFIAVSAFFNRTPLVKEEGVGKKTINDDVWITRPARGKEGAQAQEEEEAKVGGGRRHEAEVNDEQGQGQKGKKWEDSEEE